MSANNDLIPAFFCVPDITGFTKFVASADIKFTKEVIPALLRRLIESNILAMNVAEIEGDAIFFYKTGRLPSVMRVARQCQEFYTVFSEFLETLEKNHPQNHEKHLSNNQLGLKMIIHYGLISPAKIKGRTKLLGEDVIVAHKLLKNSITESSYILLSDKYLSRVQNSKGFADYFGSEELTGGREQYDYIGEVNYRYITFEAFQAMNVSAKFNGRKKTS